MRSMGGAQGSEHPSTQSKRCSCVFFWEEGSDSLRGSSFKDVEKSSFEVGISKLKLYC